MMHGQKNIKLCVLFVCCIGLDFGYKTKYFFLKSKEISMNVLS